MAEHLGHQVDLTEQLFIDGEERDYGIGWLASQTGIPERKLRRHFYEGEPLNGYDEEAIELAIAQVTDDTCDECGSALTTQDAREVGLCEECMEAWRAV